MIKVSLKNKFVFALELVKVNNSIDLHFYPFKFSNHEMFCRENAY